MNPFDPQIVSMARSMSRKLKPSRRWKPMRMESESKAIGVVTSEWVNGIYRCTLRPLSTAFGEEDPFGVEGWMRIGICCDDGQARHDWRDFQRIKNDMLGPEWEAIELFPAESRLMDPSNFFTLYCHRTLLNAFGHHNGRRICDEKTCVSPQRGWDGDAPSDVSTLEAILGRDTNRAIADGILNAIAAKK